MLKRKTYTPEIDVVHSEGFFMVSKDDAAKAIASKLTGSQYRLWHYLMGVDAFADFTSTGERIYKDIPSPAECGVAIGASARTVEKDIKVLRDLKLYDYRVTGWQGHNLTAENARLEAERLKKQKAGKIGCGSASPIVSQEAVEPAQSKGGYLAAKTVKQPDSVLNSREKGYLTENPNLHNNERAREYSDCIQTDPDLNTQERVQENLDLIEPGGSTNILVAPLRSEEASSNESQIVFVDQSSAAPLMPTQIYIPTVEEQSYAMNRLFVQSKATYTSRSADPWMDSVNPNRQFVQWILNKRQNLKKNGDERYNTYTPTLENIRKELRNDAVAAQGLWEDFQEEMSHRVEIHNTRVAAGIPISALETSEIKAIAPYSGLEVQAPKLLLPSVQATPEAKPLPAPPSTTNASAYKEYIAPAPPSEEDVADFRANFSELAKQFGISKPKAKFNEINPYSSTIERMQGWISGDDPVLRSQATSWVNRNTQNLEIDFDEEGNIISFTEVEF